jgi:glycosyltransferase involved in cell wall biosynthesis
MRIVVATQHRQIVGGVETYLRELLPALRSAGHELALLHEHPSWSEATIDARTPDMATWCASEPDWRERVTAWRPDVIFNQGLEDPDRESLLLEQYPGVLFAHNYHGTCVSGTKRFAWPHTQMCDRTLGLGCLLRYYPCRCGGLHPGTMLREYGVQKRRDTLLSRYRHVIVASRHMQSEYAKHGVAPERLHLVPYFPTDAVPDRDAPSHRPRTNRVLFVGRVILLKGLTDLITAHSLAAAQLGLPLTLVVAGDGSERKQAEAMARTSGVQAEFLGWIDGTERARQMRNADLLAVPSLWPEPFGIVGVEAGCIGLPAVAYATGGIPDWLIPGESGESAPGIRPDVKDLAAALVRALADEHHLHRLRIGAWQTSHRFNKEDHLQKIVSVLERAQG